MNRTIELIAGILLLVIGSLLVCYRLERSRIGRAWMAIREDEIAAKAMGINTRNMKLLAFGMGATFGGVSGATELGDGRPVLILDPTALKAQPSPEMLINRAYALQCLTLWEEARETWLKVPGASPPAFGAASPPSSDPLAFRRRGEWLLGEWGNRSLRGDTQTDSLLAEAVKKKKKEIKKNLREMQNCKKKFKPISINTMPIIKNFCMPPMRLNGH